MKKPNSKQTVNLQKKDNAKNFSSQQTMMISNKSKNKLDSVNESGNIIPKTPIKLDSENTNNENMTERKPAFKIEDEPNLDIPMIKEEENSDNVRVIARFRPMNKVELELVERGMGNVCVKYNKKDGCTVMNSVGFSQSYTLDRIFDSNTSQEQIFNEVAKTTINDILRGYNGTIFTYGQSGSGKTHTMYGSSLYDPDLKGMIPRCIEYMFDFINHPQNENIKFQIKFSMLEIYKENLYDLLNPEIDTKDLKIKETKDKQVYVKGLTEEYITNVEEFLMLIHQADQFRVVSETGLNKQSSRSHLLFIIEVLQQLPDGSEKCGKLNLIDLAGSEKIGKTGAVGETLEEAKKINLSLSTLGQVISSLSSGKDYIPYRDSKLTRVLQDSLGGNFKTTLIVACSPHVFNSEETNATLKFATRAKQIKNKVKANIKKSTEELERIIDDLTKKLEKAKKHIELLKKKINQLPESFKEQYKDIYEDLIKDHEAIIEEKKVELKKAKTNVFDEEPDEDEENDGNITKKIDAIEDITEEDKKIDVPQITNDLIKLKSLDDEIKDKKKIYTLNEDDDENVNDSLNNDVLNNYRNVNKNESVSENSASNGDFIARLNLATGNLSEKVSEKELKNLKGIHQKCPSEFSVVSNHLNIQVFDSPCKKKRVESKMADDDTSKENFEEFLKSANEVKILNSKKINDLESIINKLSSEKENYYKVIQHDKEIIRLLKEKIKSIEEKEYLSESKLEKLITHLCDENKKFCEGLETLKDGFITKIINSLKLENSELKKRLNSTEKEFIDLFKKIKYFENESNIINFKENPNFLENDQELLKNMEMDDYNYIQYKETFKLSKSFVKDILKFFITKQDFFNNDLYDGTFQMFECIDRLKENNIKHCLIK